MQAAQIQQAWRELKATRKLRNRDAADALGVSEAELVASAVGDTATRLEGDLRDLLKRVPELGSVMALTRNESCVHEKDGPYENISAEGMVGLALGEAIDLRLFFSHWKHAFAIEESTPRGTQRSLQVYDASGAAVHKIFLREASDAAAWRRIVDAFAAADQAPGLSVQPAPAPETPRPDAAVDIEGLRRAWGDMKDTHEFFGMLKKFGVARTQAMRLAGPGFCRPAPHDAARKVLEAASADLLEIMVFVGNRGCIQIHTGPVSNIRIMDRWVNVMDPGFNLHLREDRIAESWIVRKPTTDGDVTSLELFDVDGETIALLFGKRKPGVPESTAWRELLGRLFPA
ncbi:MAG: hemin-degrading factor [Betaproteobacteria bacterium]